MKLKLALVALSLLAVLCVSTAPAFAQGGFDQYGYNMKAMIFVGTGESWAMGKLGLSHTDAEAYMGVYAHDRLVMKWSLAWHMAVFGPDGIRENGDEWDWTPEAWCTNEWNGAVGKQWGGGIVSGSGEIEHCKIIWVGPELESSQYWRDGGYAIWGQFEVILDFYCGPAVHGIDWYAHATPNGLGGP